MSVEKLKKTISELMADVRINNDTIANLKTQLKVADEVIAGLPNAIEFAKLEGRLSAIQKHILKRIDDIEGYRKTKFHSLYEERLLVLKELRELAVLLKEGEPQ